MTKNSNDVVITSALRTPIGRYKGSLKNLSASKLGSIVIKEVIYKSKLDIGSGHIITVVSATLISQLSVNLKPIVLMPGVDQE